MTKARVKRGYLSSNQDEGEGEKWPIKSGLEFQKPEKLHDRDKAANDCVGGMFAIVKTLILVGHAASTDLVLSCLQSLSVLSTDVEVNT